MCLMPIFVPLQASASSFTLDSSSSGGSQWDGIYVKSGIVHGHSTFSLGDSMTLEFVRDLPWGISVNSGTEYVAPWIMNGVYFVDPPLDLQNSHTWTIRADDFSQWAYAPDVTLTPSQYIGAPCPVGQFPAPLVQIDCSEDSHVENIAVSLASGSEVDVLGVPEGSSGVSAFFTVTEGTDILIYSGNQCVFGPDITCLQESGESLMHGITLYAVTTNQRLFTSANSNSHLIFKARAANSNSQVLLTITTTSGTCVDQAPSCLQCDLFACPNGLISVCDGSHVFCS
eukprot:TRINITY_DN365_c0_g1_i1.p1 TRINITY_DN365_c0_g1~~TRINITY_DN365_c0_g1_i1.p1  ORF type:complete len:285 (-),score=25.42 TRINITY_DN365_c0_g1_i1:118-972(-)